MAISNQDDSTHLHSEAGQFDDMGHIDKEFEALGKDI